ncbi:MAG: hypothetical protein Fur0014_06800 [Rubrivivax sp.]
MRPWPALIAAGLLAAGDGAWAQTVQLEPSAIVGCLRLEGPGDPVPAYPEQAWKRGTAATVRDHGLRAPCLTPESSPAQLDQVYAFRPDDRRIHWSRPRDAADAAREEPPKCVVQMRQQKNPVHPSSAQREGLRGRVLAEWVFEARARPPARGPLLEWLEAAEIAAPEATPDAIIADTITVTVPCIQFDIPPQENSS